MHDYLSAAKIALAGQVEDANGYRNQLLSAQAVAQISIAESLVRIADALEAQLIQTNEKLTPKLAAAIREAVRDEH